MKKTKATRVWDWLSARLGLAAAAAERSPPALNRAERSSESP